MAVLEGSYFSKALNQDTHFILIRPFEAKLQEDPERCLILLHGLMDNCTAWPYKTNLFRLAEEYRVSVFCPEGHRAFYTDMAYGPKYRTLLIKEIPRVLKELFGITVDGENTVIAGNSMGGYGALTAVLTPDSVYRKCMAFSPVIDPVKGLEVIPKEYQIFGEEKAIYGSEVLLGDADDLYALAAAVQKEGLEITVTCGTEDFLSEENRRFQEYINSLELPVDYREAPGEHGWNYWDTHLRELFEKYFKD